MIGRGVKGKILFMPYKNVGILVSIHVKENYKYVKHLYWDFPNKEKWVGPHELSHWNE